jgi:hypothetical protein
LESALAIEFSQPIGTAAAPAAPGQAQASFHDILSALNPLQYVPVVGNIFRAVTGDSPPEPVRMVGCAIFSALTGGPIGLAIYAAVTAAEKLTGLDPDHIAHAVLASVGMVDQAPAAAASDPAQAGVAVAAYTRTQQIECVNCGHRA